ncbi:MAG: signal peptide peptidase SppA, partial [Lysobacter sp.]|nr:signal peptide peptidase SppA [Lysobacter sp.]
MNETYRRGPVARFFIGLWDAMNFTRRLVFNLLFLLLLVMFIALLSAGERIQPLLDNTTLVIAPEGALVEQYSQDPVGRTISRAMGDDGGEVQLRDLLRALDHAATDKRINRVVLRLDQLQGGGMASRREFAAAIARVRAAGKQVVAFGETMSQEQYLVASQADEVYLDPMGYLLLEGLGRSRLYYR